MNAARIHHLANGDAIKTAHTPEPPLGSTLKGDVMEVSETVTHVGQAVYAIAKLLEEDGIRKESDGSDDFLDHFTTGCLLSGLKVLSQVLWDKGEDLEKIAASKAALDGAREGTAELQEPQPTLQAKG